MTSNIPILLNAPHGSFSGIVPLESVVARSDSALVVLTEIRAYVEGCLLDFSSRAIAPGTSGGYAEDPSLFVAPQEGADPNPNLLRFSVYQQGGLSATTLQAAIVRSRVETPEFPVLLPVGGEVSRASGFRYYNQPVWLSPLPASSEVLLETSWPSFDIVNQRFILDGARIVRASRSAEKYPL